MASHNASAYIGQAVDSVLGQSLADLELIIVDDCSSDGTLDIAKGYEKLDRRVSVLSMKANSGPGPTRNAGIHAARGTWIAILDSDDIAMPSRLKEQLLRAELERELVMVGSDSISIDQHGRAILEHSYPTEHRRLVGRLYSMRAFVPHSSIMYRADLVRRLGSFNSRYRRAEDYDLWLRLSERGRVASVNKPLVKIRKHAANRSHTGDMLPTLKFAFAGCICHFLRATGNPDPSRDRAQTAWEEFLDWVGKRMLEEGIFERRRTWLRARAEYLATRRRAPDALRVAGQLFRAGHGAKLIRERLFGSSFPERLAREWCTRRNVAAA